MQRMAVGFRSVAAVAERATKVEQEKWRRDAMIHTLADSYTVA
jgi:hypothetical protein